MTIRPTTRHRKLVLSIVALAIALAMSACQPAVSALVQRTACNNTVPPPPVGNRIDACTHWVNRNAAWQYPPNTEWIGPYSDYLFDLSHGNGAERLP